jgi:hypothetical protein
LPWLPIVQHGLVHRCSPISGHPALQQTPGEHPRNIRRAETGRRWRPTAIEIVGAIALHGGDIQCQLARR